jgi:hypothetical protein
MLMPTTRFDDRSGKALQARQDVTLPEIVHSQI